MFNSEKTEALVKVQNDFQKNSSREEDSASVEKSIHSRPSIKRSPEVTHNVDILKQFSSNINQIEDLHGRLQFALKDVSTIISKRFK